VNRLALCRSNGDLLPQELGDELVGGRLSFALFLFFFSYTYLSSTLRDLLDSSTYKRQDMRASTFDVKERRKRITVFKVGKLWLFKQFFEDKEIFKALLGYYNQDNYRFEFKSVGERNNTLKILERNGFDYELVEDLRSYVVKLPRFAKYAQILKNSVATKETATERLFLMKDLAAVEEAVGLGAEKVEGDVVF